MTQHTKKISAILATTALISLPILAASEPVQVDSLPITEQVSTNPNLEAKFPHAELGKLEAANAALMKKNALLEQENNTLKTQVNVLTAERNNQLFLYGAALTTITLIIGFIAGWVVIGKRSDW